VIPFFIPPASPVVMTATGEGISLMILRNSRATWDKPFWWFRFRFIWNRV